MKKQDRSTRSSLGSEASHPHARVHQRLTPQNSAEDTILPGASRIPPEPSPLGNGLVPDESMIGISSACKVDKLSMLLFTEFVTLVF